MSVRIVARIDAEVCPGNFFLNLGKQNAVVLMDSSFDLYSGELAQREEQNRKKNINDFL
jgi:hypothetical protein